MWAEVSLPTFSCEGRIILDLFTVKRSLSTILNLDVFPSATARFLNFCWDSVDSYFVATDAYVYSSNFTFL